MIRIFPVPQKFNTFNTFNNFKFLRLRAEVPLSRLDGPGTRDGVPSGPGGQGVRDNA